MPKSRPPGEDPITRRLFNIFTVVSLVLCMATAGLWVRSLHNADRLDGRLWGRQAFLLASKQGQLAIVGFHCQGADNGWTWDVRTHATDDIMSFPQGDARQYVNGAGFGTLRRPSYLVMDPVQQTPQGEAHLWGAATATLSGSGIVIPFWLPVLLFAVTTAFFLTAGIRRARRYRLGRCAICGYDLRATPERCLECGTVAITEAKG